MTCSVGWNLGRSRVQSAGKSWREETPALLFKRVCWAFCPPGHSVSNPFGSNVERNNYVPLILFPSSPFSRRARRGEAGAVQACLHPVGSGRWCFRRKRWLLVAVGARVHDECAGSLEPSKSAKPSAASTAGWWQSAGRTAAASDCAAGTAGHHGSSWNGRGKEQRPDKWPAAGRHRHGPSRRLFRSAGAKQPLADWLVASAMAAAPSQQSKLAHVAACGCCTGGAALATIAARARQQDARHASTAFRPAVNANPHASRLHADGRAAPEA